MNNWVRTELRRPTNGKEVLCYFKETDSRRLLYFDEKVGWEGGREGGTYQEPDFWMYIPEPPK